MEMQEIRNAALAYYQNLSDELKQKVSEKFKEMDSNGNGTINIKEFRRSLGSSAIKKCFKLLDKSGDGMLDFDEFITLYYLVESGRGVFCSGHGCKASSFLNGLYFTCVECFHNNEAATFDLCTSCYRDGKYVHDHASFLDNYVLLRSKAACESSKAIDDDDLDEPNPAESDQVVSQGLKTVSTSETPNSAESDGVISRGVQGLKTVSNFVSRPGSTSETPSSSKMEPEPKPEPQPEPEPESEPESEPDSEPESDQVAPSGSKRRAVFEAIKSLNSQVSFEDVAAESSSCSIM